MAGKGLLGPLRLQTTATILVYFLFMMIICMASSSSSSKSMLVSAAAAPAGTTTEAEALLEFKAALSSYGGEAALRSWTQGSDPCSDNRSNWVGVICTNSKVWGLQLEHMSLSGQLNLTALSSLPSLRAISFMNNNLVGPMPDISSLGALKSLYLSNNQFSGEIPDGAFAGTRSLKKVFMSNNNFSGKIPSSLTLPAKLLFLRLDANGFEGEIPDLQQQGLILVNFSYNKLEGRIPASLSDMDQSLFAGNKNLCGPPLEATCPSPPSSNNKSSRALLIGIIAAAVIVFFVLCCICFALCCRRPSGESTNVEKKKKMDDALAVEKLEQGGGSVSGGSTASGGSGGGGGRRGDPQHGKLSFITDQAAHGDHKDKDQARFELQDLLRASAEVLGSGNFGSSYKAVLVNGPSVVVKRYKEMNRVGREDFQEHMRRLGRLSHPNVLPLVAYYYRKEEKLIITNHILNGSLAHMLHGNRGSNLPPLEWPTRLKIIKGVARGLAYLYEELPMLTLPHGHLKSSNVLIDDSYEALLTDYALVPVVNLCHASQVMVAYKSPEVSTTNGQPSKKSDVWSLGILILEVLTGKFPAICLQKGKGTEEDLAGWVNSVVKEEWTGGEVFDSHMKNKNGEEAQMLKLLHIGLACCEADVDKRCDIKQALEKIEELTSTSTSAVASSDDVDDSSFLSEVELHSSSKDDK